MTILPGWTCVSLQLFLIAALSAYSAFAQTCNCGMQYGGNCHSCYLGCYLDSGNCYRCKASCISCVDYYNCDSCIKGYYGNSCDYECRNCKDNTCHKNDGRCTNGCAYGYYSNTGSGGCSQCSTQCRTCNSWSDCTACIHGYYGPSCLSVCSNCRNNTCNKHNGHCTDGCADGFYPRAGSAGCFKCFSQCITCNSWTDCTACEQGYYGVRCEYACESCKDNKCHKDNGQCLSGCVDGFYPLTGSTACSKCSTQCRTCNSWTNCTACKQGYYGASCESSCFNCKDTTCYKDNGHCTDGCVDGYYQQQSGGGCVRCPSQCVRCNSGTECTACNTGYHGPSCGLSCDQNCKHGACNSITGVCTNGCKEGYYLSNGNCLQCSGRCVNGECNNVDGSCTEGCKDGFTNRYCNDLCYPNCIACEQYNKEICTSCQPGYHGQQCEYDCYTQCNEVGGVRQCDKTNGECTHGCENGYTGPTCSDKCSINCLSCDQNHQPSCDSCIPGYFGTECDQECSSNCGKKNNTIPCLKDTGMCLVNCTQGYRGPKCDVPCEAGCQDGCDRETGECERCTTLFYGSSCEHTCNSTCYNPNNGSSVCDKHTGNCSFECSASQCGFRSGQENVGGSDNNGAIIGAAAGSVIVVLIVVVLVIVFIMIRRKRTKTSNPEPDGMEGNIDAVYSVPDKKKSSKTVESTALYAIHDKSTSVQPNSSTPGIYENGVYSNVDEIQRFPTIGAVYANDDCLEEIDQDDIDNGTLADVEGPKVDNYYNIYGLTRSRIQLDKLNNYVSSKTADGFEKEFKKLPEGLNRPYDDAVSPKNASKNRYKGIYPYDATRVKLEGKGGDYINASYIEGFGEIEKTYIASLGPIKMFMKGYVDFWRMVWQENVNKIVMLTNFVEGTKEKCDKYWPEIGQTETYGHVKVECINVEVFADFNISKLNVSTVSNPKTTTIHHFHFTAWPDRGIPSNVVSLVEFRESVERVNSTTKGPTVVHCSAGIGRTGTYIALDILTREGQTEGYVDIFGCVLSLRGQRVGMVQNVDQYRYLHHAIEHSLTTNCEQIENGNFCRVSADQIDEGFHLLKNMKDYKDEEETKAIEKNKKEQFKNRKGADIPGDVGRPKLSNHHKGAQPQYINAVYVDSYKQTNKYILAQTPLPTTVEDFLELVLQENCSCIISLDDTENTRKQDIGLYVPAGDNELSIGKFKVKVTNSESTPEYGLRYITIDVQGTGADESKTIPHYQFTDWPANSLVPASVDSFLNLIRDTECTIRDSANEEGPVLVNCLTGAERCGLIPAVNNLIEKLGVEQQASVVDVARQIRARRARSIPNKEQFQFSYLCVKQFVESSSVYVNVL